MLIKAGELLNKRIVSYDTGNNCGEIKDVAISVAANKVVGIYYQNSGILKREEKFLALKNILHVEHQNITVQEEFITSKITEQESEKFVNHRGKKVISKDGKELGILEDIAFKVPNGEMEYFEVSDGIICDLINGRKRLSYDDVIVLGKDFLVVN